MTGVLIERGNLDTDVHIGRILSKDEGRFGARNAKNWQQTTRNSA